LPKCEFSVWGPVYRQRDALSPGVRASARVIADLKTPLFRKVHALSSPTKCVVSSNFSTKCVVSSNMHAESCRNASFQSGDLFMDDVISRSTRVSAIADLKTPLSWEFQGRSYGHAGLSNTRNT